VSNSQLSWVKLLFAVAAILHSGVIARNVNECGYNWVLC